MYGCPARCWQRPCGSVCQWEMVSDVLGDVGGSVCATSVGVWGAVNDVCGR